MGIKGNEAIKIATNVLEKYVGDTPKLRTSSRSLL
jgi:hypothetical protein